MLQQERKPKVFVVKRLLQNNVSYLYIANIENLILEK